MAKVTINGERYTLPDMETMTMGQARILKRYTGLTLNQLTKTDPSDPDLIAAMCHLALKEAQPGASFAELEAQVDTAKITELNFDAEEADAGPPASGQNETPSETSGSGESGTSTSEENPETTLRSIGAQA